MNTTMDHLHTVFLALPTVAALERLQPADTLAPVRDVVSRGDEHLGLTRR